MAGSRDRQRTSHSDFAFAQSDCGSINGAGPSDLRSELNFAGVASGSACPEAYLGSDFTLRTDSKGIPMSTKPAAVSLSDVLGLSRLLFDAADGVTGIVEQMHNSILATPGVAPIDQGVTGGVTQPVYRGVRGAFRLTGKGIGGAAALVDAKPDDRPTSPRTGGRARPPQRRRRRPPRLDRQSARAPDAVSPRRTGGRAAIRPDYGKLIVYEFPKDKLVYGPFQIEALINQNTEISQQISLWNQMGSRVIRGNLAGRADRELDPVCVAALSARAVGPAAGAQAGDRGLRRPRGDGGDAARGPRRRFQMLSANRVRDTVRQRSRAQASPIRGVRRANVYLIGCLQ